MMFSQPQPPPQPINPNDLPMVLDRMFVKLTTYIDSRVENLSVQIRLNNQEALLRDQDLANAVLTLTQRVSDLDHRVTSLEQRITKVEETQQLILQVVVDFRAEVMEALNDLRRKDKE